jgi:predicted DNA binding CopG/RHH family protein
MKKRSDFVWDDTKDKLNQNKHSVSFALSQLAFLSESLELDIGEKERKYMKKKIKYTNEPIGKVRVLKDFLPSPEELVLKDETVKVTISLSKISIDFFKKEAKKHNTQYQKMIRRLLDEYTAHQP